jgi:hypothetical protein
MTLRHGSVCLVRMDYEQEASNQPPQVAVAMVECRVRKEIQEPQEMTDYFDLLEADFFDDESMIIVYRLRDTRGNVNCNMFLTRC